MRLIYEDAECAPIALFAFRQLEVILSQQPFDAFDTSDVILRVRANGVPGAWYYSDTHEIIVDISLYQYALDVLTQLFTSPRSVTGLPLVESAKVYDTMLAHYVTRRYQDNESYSNGFGPNHWVRGYRITCFEAFVSEHLQANPDLAKPINELRHVFGPDVVDVALSLSLHLDQCVDVARFFFVFVCLHELGHHVYKQDTTLRSRLFQIAGEEVVRQTADASAVPDEEHYADAFAVIGVTMCRETSLSSEQFLFVRAFFEFMVGTLIDTALLLEDILHSARYANNRLIKFLRFNGLRELQRETTSILGNWEVTSRKTRTLEMHWITANPSFKSFDFHFFANLHAQWLEQARLAMETEGRIGSFSGGI